MKPLNNIYYEATAAKGGMSMGVYIKGMEMPKSCLSCPLQGGTADCRLTQKTYNWGLTKRPSDCPLAPVPKHGRLIDADALRCLYDPHDYGLDGEQVDEYDRYHVSLPVIRQNIDDMPTIIEAEEDKT